MFQKARTIGALTAFLFVTVSVAAHAENQVTFGSQWWWQSDPEARYREYADLARGGFVESFLLSGASGRDAYSLWGENALRRDQTTGLRLSRGVNWQLDLKNSQLPHVLSAIARSPYTEVRPGVYILPDSVQALGQRLSSANYLQMMRDLMATAPLVDNTIQTDVSSARLRGRPAPGWRFEVKGERRDRSGHKPYGATFGFSNAIELMEPIHQSTLDGQATASYERSRVKLQGSLGVSDFRNDVGALVWDNPKGLTGTSAVPSRAQLDLYPDNRVVRGNVALGVALPRKTMFSATVGISQGTQDDKWLPYTINSAVLQSALDSLPARSSDGKMVRLNMDYRLTTRAWSRIAGTLRYNRTHADNQTPERLFTGYSVNDAGFTASAHRNHAYGNTQAILGADVDARPMDRVGIGATYEMREREHTLREVEKDEETVYSVRASAEVTDDLRLTGSYRHGDRELDHFNLADYQNAAGVYIEQPLLRRFDVADRKQDLAGATLGWDLTTWFQTSLEYTYRVNDYPDSRYGLTREQEQMVVVDGTLKPSDRTELGGGYGYGLNKVAQASNESNHTAPPSADAATDWTANITDKNVYVYVDGRWWAIPKKVSVTASFELERVLGESGLRSGTAIDLPATFYRRQTAQLGAHWRVAAGTELGGRWTFEELDFVDILKENIPLLQVASGAITSVWLGNSTLDYRAHRLEMLLTRRF